MLKSIRRALRVATGYRFMDVAEESSERLTIKALGLTTTVNRSRGEIVQNGKRVASVQALKDIYLSRPTNYDGPENWCIAFRFQGGRRLEIGTVTDSTDASLLAAKLSTVTGRPVRLQ